MKIYFNKKYFFAFLMLFVIEVLIALFVRDAVIRPYFGDYLVVILIYCFLRSFIKTNKYKIAFAVLIFAFVIEFLQFIDFLNIVGFKESRLARTIIGTFSSFEDLLLYFLGYLTIIFIERVRSKKRKTFA